jgi:hypothetical protein
MGASQWSERVRVFARGETQDNRGLPVESYAFQNSEEPDGAFPMSRGVPNGRDAVVANQRDFKSDAVFCCPDDVPVEDSSILRDLADSRLYRVRKKEHARRRGEFVLLTEHAAIDTDPTVVITGEP